jgi:hypothetical protein
MPFGINAVVGEEQLPTVFVSIGDVTNDGPSGKWIDPPEGIFTDYWVVNRYERDRQRWMLGVTSPDGFNGDQVAFVQLAADTLLLVSDWTAERRGEQPTIPQEEPADENLVLLDDHYEPAQLLLGANGQTAQYRISGTYVYGFKNPNQAQITYPRPPWLADTFDRIVSDGSKQTGIIDANGAGGGEEASPGSAGSQNSPTNPSQAGLSSADFAQD